MRLALAALALCALGAAWFALSRSAPEQLAAAPSPSAPREATEDEPVFLRSPSVEVALPPSEPAEPVEKARAEPAAAALELTREEIEALRAETPPGTLEVLVFAGREHVEGASVVVRPFRLEELPDDLRLPLEGGLAQRTDARGLAVFTHLEPATYLINVRAEPRHATWLIAEVEDDEAKERLLVLFGAGGIRGRAYRADGSPWPGAIVFATYPGAASSGAPPVIGRALVPATTTDADGEYALGGMPSGSVRVENISLENGVDERFAELALSPGEWKELDFGSPRGSTLWRGTIVLPSGEPLLAAGRLELREVASGVRTRVSFDGSGRFERALDRGTHEMWLPGFEAPVSLGRVVLDGPELEHDPIVPGLCLTGSISYSGSRGDRAQEARHAQVWLQHEAGRSAPASLRWNERFAFLGLAPGRYELRVQPHALVGAPNGRLPLNLARERGSETLELEITDP